jgi:hypothetical protein
MALYPLILINVLLMAIDYLEKARLGLDFLWVQYLE